jgi:dihydroorotate dehydrogenase (NAD+) catalytic subunit
MVDLSVELAGVQLRNPLVAAAGTCGYVDEVADVLDPTQLGAIVTKSITREPREGHPPWRLLDVPRGMINAVGLANVGLQRFLAEKLPTARRLGTVLIGSIAGNSIDDYVAVAAAFDGHEDVRLVELNVSCPNTADGTVFGEDAARLAELVRAVRAVLRRARMLVKLSPDVGDVVKTARAAVDAGADGLTLVNTFLALSIDVETRRSRLGRGDSPYGGLSGPAVHPIALRMVHQVARAVARPAGIPIVGTGGVMRWEDAAEFILAGATAVGMGTALFVDPRLALRVRAGLERWARRQGAARIADLVGRLEA